MKTDTGWPFGIHLTMTLHEGIEADLRRIFITVLGLPAYGRMAAAKQVRYLLCTIRPA